MYFPLYLFHACLPILFRSSFSHGNDTSPCILSPQVLKALLISIAGSSVFRMLAMLRFHLELENCCYEHHACHIVMRTTLATGLEMLDQNLGCVGYLLKICY